MSNGDKKYRFLLMQAFQFSSNLKNSTVMPDQELPKEQKLFNYDNVRHLLDDVDWDFNPGPVSPYGDWPVENREEFCLVAAARLPLIREACESGKYNAIVLLGGGEPGFVEAREIARQYSIPVTANAFSQMHIATMLGNRFSVIDLAESHNMHYYDLVVRHHFAERCASIRNINFPLPRPGSTGKFILDEREKALRGEPSEAVDKAVTEAVTAIEEDGAEVITFGCSATFWLQPFVKKRLEEMGWDVPVLEGYSCSIVLAKAMVGLGVDASGLYLPGNHPKRWRRKKVF
jgi:allantoin racemase